MLKKYPLIIACLIHAAPSSAEYIPIFHMTGENSSSCLGQDISNCGDQNGDGADELLISSQYPTEVLMFYGGDELDTIPDMVFGLNYGYVGPMIYCENLLSQDFGSLIISQILNGYSKLYLYDCGTELDTIPDMIFQEEQQYNDGYGGETGVGDINGDGWNDIVTSAQALHEFGSMDDFGKLYVYYGGPDMDTIPDFTITAAYNDFGHLLGCGIACGDVNGDGFADILAMTSSPRKAWLFYGGAELDSIPDWSYQASSPVYLTTLCTIVPNLNGDEYADIILEPSNISDTYVFFGGETLNNSPNQSVNIPGGTITYIGNLNGDEYGDMIGKSMVNSLIIPLYGSESGIIQGTLIDTEGSPIAVGKSGDINGDGFDDLAFSLQEPLYYGQFFVYADTTLNSVNINPEQIASDFELYQNYPNPFNSSTIISFNTTCVSDVVLSIYNTLGQKVAELLDQNISAGYHEIKWNAEGLSSGIYFVELRNSNQKEIMKMQLLR